MKAAIITIALLGSTAIFQSDAVENEYGCGHFTWCPELDECITPWDTACPFEGTEFEGPVTISCTGGRCSLPDGCTINMGSWNAGGLYMDRMDGEFPIPGGCTFTCDGCAAVSSATETQPIIEDDSSFTTQPTKASDSSTTQTTATEASGSSTTQTTEASGSSTTQTTDASNSNTTQPTEAASSSTTQPTKASGSSTTQTTEASNSSTTQTTEASTSNTTQPTEAADSSTTQPTEEPDPQLLRGSSASISNLKLSSLCTCIFLAFALGFV